MIILRDFPYNNALFELLIYWPLFLRGRIVYKNCIQHTLIFQDFIDAVAEVKRTCPGVSFTAGVSNLSHGARTVPWTHGHPGFFFVGKHGFNNKGNQYWLTLGCDVNDLELGGDLFPYLIGKLKRPRISSNFLGFENHSSGDHPRSTFPQSQATLEGSGAAVLSGSNAPRSFGQCFLTACRTKRSQLCLRGAS